MIKTTRVRGNAIFKSEPTSAFVYALTAGSKTVSTEFLPEDPFTLRGFPDPKGKQKEFYGRADEATIIVKVPQDQVSAIGEGKLSLELYRITSTSPLTTIDNAILDQLKVKKQVARELQVPSKAVANALQIGIQKAEQGIQ